MALFNEKKEESPDLDRNDSPLGKEQNDLEANGLSRRRSTIVKGKKMNRIGPPVVRSGSIAEDTNANGSDVDDAQALVELEAGNAIKYRTCSWYKTAGLLFSEYICLAIMSFPYSYSVLGLVPGLIMTVVVAAFVLYTSLIVW